jgi:hypothetical protein
MKKVPTLLAALMLSAGIAGVAQADAFTDQVVADLQGKGYTRIEVKVFDNTVKVEAINGTQKLEVIYDRATGAIIKTENESVRPGEDTSPGVEIDDETGDDDEDEDEDEDDDDEDEDDDNSGPGNGDDDDEDEDESEDDGDEDEDDHENDPNHD